MNVKSRVLTALILTASMNWNTSAVAQEVIQLEPIIITQEVPDTSNSYLLSDLRSATKTDTDILETPQSLTILTRKQFDDQNTQTVGQALRYTAGVLSEVDASTRYDSVFIRGFGGFGTSTKSVSHLDGLRLPVGQAFARSSIDPFFLDRVDILKGPSALAYGFSSPGGLVNMVSRTPDGSTGGEARFEVGSYGRVQVGAEQHGVLDEDGDFKYSIAGIGRSSGTRYDDVDDERYGLSSKLVWEPTDRTRVTVSGYYQRDPEGGYFNSILPTSLGGDFASFLTRDLNTGDPNFDSFDRTQWGISAGVEHAFASNVVLRSKLRYGEIETDLAGIQLYSLLSDTGLLPRAAVTFDESVRAFTWDTNLEYGFQTGAFEHTLLVGADLTWNDSDLLSEFAFASSLDVTNPSYDDFSGTFITTSDVRQVTRQQALYVSDQIAFGNFHAVLGLRHDWLDTETENDLSSTKTEQDSEETTYRAALLYRFDNGVAPYASYSTSFEPEIGTDENGDAFVPTTGEQWEVGLKYQPDGLDALFTVALFDATQENVLTASDTPNFFVQTGEIRSRGLEFEARGTILPNLEAIASLTLLDTEVTESTDESIIGNKPQAVPDHYGSLWLNYSFGGNMQGLTLGGGVRVVGSSFGDDENTLKADGYTLTDMALNYDLNRFGGFWSGTQIALNVRNVFDEVYYSSCSFDIFCQYGEGRVVTASLRKTW